MSKDGKRVAAELTARHHAKYGIQKAYGGIPASTYYEVLGEPVAMVEKRQTEIIAKQKEMIALYERMLENNRRYIENSEKMLAIYEGMLNPAPVTWSKTEQFVPQQWTVGRQINGHDHHVPESDGITPGEVILCHGITARASDGINGSRSRRHRPRKTKTACITALNRSLGMSSSGTRIR